MGVKLRLIRIIRGNFFKALYIYGTKYKTCVSYLNVPAILNPFMYEYILIFSFPNSKNLDFNAAPHPIFREKDHNSVLAAANMPHPTYYVHTPIAIRACLLLLLAHGTRSPVLTVFLESHPIPPLLPRCVQA